MPFPALAAIATTAYSVGSQILAKRQEALRANVQKSLGTLARAAGGAIVGGGAGAFVASQVSNVGQGNIIPGIPTMRQFQASPTVQRLTGMAGGPMTFDISTGRRRYRRMNVCNVKALRRAGRRVEGFVKLAKSLITMPGARAKHPIKGRRRRR
jgi:hypothetical protein